MEFGSSILADLWTYETTSDAAQLEDKRKIIAGKFQTIEAELSAEPFFAGEDFCLVDAVFAPIFRYFDVFDMLAESHIFDGLSKVQAWRRELAQRPSVRAAASPDYPERLMTFLEKHQSVLLRRNAA